MSKLLFDNDSDDDNTGFQTNKEYAKSYNKFRQKELMKKLKDKENGDDSDSSSDSSSTDNDDGIFNPKFDEEFFKTLSSLRRKDDAIYEKSTKFFEDEHILDKSNDPATNKEKKKITIKQYEQDILLKNGGVYDEDNELNDDFEKHPLSTTYNDEQKQIKDEFKKVLASDDLDDEGEEGENFGGLFMKHQKSKEEQTEDDKQQEKWLAEHTEIKEKSKSINDIWSNSKLSKDEKFLRDYILTNGYADREIDDIPTYDEIVGDNDFEEKQTEFEHKYNFRYEDPDQEFIKRYPRTIEYSVRKVDNRRKEKRVERRERKEQEKKDKFKEIEMLKELKRKEIEEKMLQLKAVTGTDDINIHEINLDDDFDPDAHDKKMNEIFNSEYYDVDEGDEKPECPSDIEDLKIENYDEYEADGGHCEDDDFNMDCDYDETAVQQKKTFQDEIIESTRSRRKRKRKSKFMEMLETKKPTFNPNDHKNYGEFLDEYYKLECEDIIDDVKCRFKYVETTPCDYGLTVEEILMAKNKELNAWASLKKATQIRPEHVERNEQAIFQKKARNEMLKRKILCSLFEASEDEKEREVRKISKPLELMENSDTIKEEKKAPEKTEITKSNKKKKNKNKKLNEPSSTVTTDLSKKKSTDSVPDEKLIKPETIKEKPKIILAKPKNAAGNNAIKRFNEKHNKSKQLKHVAQKTIQKNISKKSNGLSDERLKAFGINPKKFKKKQKYGQNPSNSPAKPQTNKGLAVTKFKTKLKNKLKKALNV